MRRRHNYVKNTLHYHFSYYVKHILQCVKHILQKKRESCLGLCRSRKHPRG